MLAVTALLSSLAVAQLPRLAGGAPGSTPISGSFFADFDRDGTIDPIELVDAGDRALPPAGITATITDAAGTSLPCSTTATTYSCATEQLIGTNFRVEFALSNDDETAGWTATFQGPDSQSSVQMVKAGGSANFGIVPPSKCPVDGVGVANNPNTADGKVWTTCFVNGRRTNAANAPALVGMNFDDQGAVEKIGLIGGLGAVWGIAYDEWDSTLFTSAYLKRHSDLGPKGLAGLYWSTYPSTTWSSVDLSALPGAPAYGAPGDPALTAAARGLGGSNAPSLDAATFGLIGKRGIGDIDVMPDGRTLLVANLYQRTVDLYDVDGARLGNDPVFMRSVQVTDPGCGDGAFEIHALKAFDSDTGLVGVTCTAQTSQNKADLAAHVVSFELSDANASDVLFSQSLAYTRGCQNSLCANPANGFNGDYEPWLDTYGAATAHHVFEVGKDNRLVFYAQPIFSDIEIDSDGSLIMAFMDRSGNQWGWFNRSPNSGDTNMYRTNHSGELLRACNTSSQAGVLNWVIEGSSGCDSQSKFPNGAAQLGDNDYHGGPLTDAEWYGADGYEQHTEASQGGIYSHPIRDQLAVSVESFNPQGAGIAWYNNSNGQPRNGDIDRPGRQLIAGNDGGDTSFGKAINLGDVEGCAIAMQIGNFVWLDLDGDGVQDPGETPLAGVRVFLVDSKGLTVAWTTTDEFGHYTFDSYDGLEPGTEYTLEFDVLTNTTPLPHGFTNEDLVETLPNATVGGSDTTDSDVRNAVISLVTGPAGTNDHSFDAGFTLPFDLALDKVVDIETVDINASSATFVLTVHNQGQTVENFSVADYLDYPTTGVWVDFSTASNPAGTTDALATGTYSGLVDLDFDGVGDVPLAYEWDGSNPRQPVVNFTGVLPAGQAIRVPITLEWAEPLPDGLRFLENWAEITNFDDGDDTTGDAQSGDLVDVDSTPDGDSANDNQPGSPGDQTDDEIDEDGKQGGDEDDHDVAGFQWFDLALMKRLADGSNLAAVTPGSTVTFVITVVNQGLIDAKDVVVTDYLPAGLTLADNDWAAQPDGTISTMVASLPIGQSLPIDLTVTVAANATGQINNWAEISQATPIDENGNTITDGDGRPIPDIDSVADGDATNDNQPSGPNAGTDDELGENGLAGGDEDDHDVAGITVSSTTTTSTGSSTTIAPVTTTTLQGSTTTVQGSTTTVQGSTTTLAGPTSTTQVPITTSTLVTTTTGIGANSSTTSSTPSTSTSSLTSATTAPTSSSSQALISGTTTSTGPFRSTGSTATIVVPDQSLGRSPRVADALVNATPGTPLAGTERLGAAPARAMAYTGSTSLPMVLFGFGLVLVGLSFYVQGRQRRTSN
jgi:uncharacterized repeat protein (TIGR01451 family)